MADAMTERFHSRYAPPAIESCAFRECSNAITTCQGSDYMPKALFTCDEHVEWARLIVEAAVKGSR